MDSHQEVDRNLPPLERLGAPLDDLLDARDILLQFFPPELVYLILDAAQYWVHMEFARAQHVEVQAVHSSTNDMAFKCYLVTPPILDACIHKDETILVRIASVQFTVVSHDQGWCSDGGARGNYITRIARKVRGLNVLAQCQ
ncbi:hypothetical protein C8R47DRAFT_1322519 [Mycena vitilis]|nr:hypothetical protein C8R47DRAFT_1322519 [Mycena vitilis]